MISIDTSMGSAGSQDEARKGRLRFGLRTALGLMTIICVVLAMGPYRAREYDARKERAKKLIRSLGGEIHSAGYSLDPSPGANFIAGMLGFGEGRERFWRVQLQGTRPTIDQIRQIADCGWIRGLDLSNTGIDDLALVQIARITKIRQLKIPHTKVTDAGIAELAALERLDLLDVNGTAVTYDALGRLDARFPDSHFSEQLAIARLAGGRVKQMPLPRPVRTTLLGDIFPPSTVPTVSSINFFNGNEIQLTDQELTDICHLTNAVSLDAQGVGFPRSGLVKLRELIKLQSIELREMRTPLFSDDDLRIFGHMPALKKLSLHGNSLTDRGVANLSDAHQIEHLILSGKSLTPALLTNIHGLRSLRALELNLWYRNEDPPRDGPPPVEVVHAARDCMMHLSAMPNLQTLTLGGNYFVDDVVTEIKSAKQLKLLKLSGRFVSQQAADQLRKVLPNCTVHRSSR
jgi:hypothetical protein